jgi:DNA-binding NtrC family response regulator
MRKNKVLVVEGQAETQEAVRKHLLLRGFEVIEANSCASAEEVWRTARPDLAVLGAHLPDGDSMALSSRLQAIDDAAPIVILTANSPLDVALEAVHFGTQSRETKTLREVEQHYIKEVLRREGWRVELAAKKLGIPRSSLYHKIKQYGLSRAAVSVPAFNTSNTDSAGARTGPLHG